MYCPRWDSPATRCLKCDNKCKTCSRNNNLHCSECYYPYKKVARMYSSLSTTSSIEISSETITFCEKDSNYCNGETNRMIPLNGLTDQCIICSAAGIPYCDECSNTSCLKCADGYVPYFQNKTVEAVNLTNFTNYNTTIIERTCKPCLKDIDISDP